MNIDKIIEEKPYFLPSEVHLTAIFIHQKRAFRKFAGNLLEKVLEKCFFDNEKSLANAVFTRLFLWQGQKGSNPRHAVLETSILSLFDAVSEASGDISRDI